MFVTYTHVDELKSPSKRWQVNSYHRRRYMSLRPTLPSTDLSARSSRPRVLPWRTKNTTRHAKEAEPLALKDPSLDSREIPRAGLLQNDEETIDDLTPVQIVGGIRRDPFKSFPSEQLPNVHWTIDYFIHVYAPFNATTYRDEDGGNWLISGFFPMALQTDILFSCLILFVWSLPATSPVLAALEKYEHIYANIRSSVIRKLHRRLGMPVVCSDDITIATITILMAADYLRELDEHVHLHLQGLKRLVDLRGGISKCGSPQIQFQISASETMCEFAISRRNSRNPDQYMTPEEVLEYPKHPYSVELCAEIAALPEGLGEMAITEKVSLQAIGLLRRCSETIKQTPTKAQIHSSFAIDMMRLVTCSRANSLEKTLILACYVFRRILGDKLQEEQYPFRSLRRQYGTLVSITRNFSKTIFNPFDGARTQDFAIWAVYVFASAPREYGLPQEEQDELMQKLFRQFPQMRCLDVALGVLNKFFFHEAVLGSCKQLWERQERRISERG